MGRNHITQLTEGIPGALVSLEFLLFRSTHETEFVILTDVGPGSTMRPSEKCSLVTGRLDPNCSSAAVGKAEHDAHSAWRIADT